MYIYVYKILLLLLLSQLYGEISEKEETLYELFFIQLSKAPGGWFSYGGEYKIKEKFNVIYTYNYDLI